jgi:hypothetical protein
MPGLLDIAPPEISVERVDIRGTELEVRGIRNREWAMLLRRFPELRKQAAGGSVSDEDMAVASIEIMPAVIAAGLGNTGDAKTEALIAERLTDAEQAEVFGAVMRLTNPPSPLAESPAGAGREDGKAKTTTPPA